MSRGGEYDSLNDLRGNLVKLTQKGSFRVWRRSTICIGGKKR